MAIEVIPKSEKRSKLVKYALYFSVAFLVIIIGASAFLYYSTDKARERLTKLDNQLNQEMSKENKKLQDKIINTRQQIQNSSRVIESHQSVYSFLNSLATCTHPQVQFTRLDLEVSANQIRLLGITEEFVDLAQQIEIFRKQSSIKKVKVERVSMASEGKVEFEIILTSKSKIFSFPY